MEVEVKLDFIIQLYICIFIFFSWYEDFFWDKYCRLSEKEWKKLWSKEQFLFDFVIDWFKCYNKVFDGDILLKDCYVNCCLKCVRLIKGKKKKNWIDFFFFNLKEYSIIKIVFFNEFYFEVFLFKFCDYFDVQQVCRLEIVVELV